MFSENFNRPNSGTVGNGWEAVAAFSIVSSMMESSTAASIMSPATAQPGRIVTVEVRFAHNEQEARIYFDGTDAYAGLRPTNFDSSSKKNLYIFMDGALQDAVDVNFLYLNYPHRFSVCISENKVHAMTSDGEATYEPGGALSFTGLAGVGCLGEFGSGPVKFDNFYVGLVSETCHSCVEDAECEGCSSGYSWLADLSGFTGMVPYITSENGFYPAVNCDPCSDGFGEYLLEQNEFCGWQYDEQFCVGYDAVPGFGCSPNFLNVRLRTNFTEDEFSVKTCSARLTITLSEEPGQCFTFNPVEQHCTYTAGPHALDTAGPDVVTLYLDPPDQVFYNESPNRIPSCVESSEIVDGITVWTPYRPPATITITRVPA